jgi:hypothetical protein
MTVQSKSDLINNLLRGMEIVSFMKPHARKWRHLGIFESQSSYFSHFGRAETFKPAAFEMIVKKGSGSRK